MPKFDGTGPWGMGPGTGWRLGPCGAGMAWRRGLRRGFSCGKFWGYPYQSQINKKEEKEMLENEIMSLEEELKAIKARLAELKEQE